MNLTCLPGEILLAIFKLLRNKELKAARAVSKKFNSVARPLLFRSIQLSMLPCDIHRLASISRAENLAIAVKEIIFNEIQFDANNRTSANRAAGDVPCYEGRFVFAFQMPVSLGIFRDVDKDWEIYEEPSQNYVRDLGKSLQRRHEVMKEWVATNDSSREARFCDSRFTKALSKFTRLKRIISRDARDGGIQLNSAYQDYALRHYEGLYPVGEGQLQHLIFDQSERSPDLGFWALLEGLARSEAKVHTLVTERTIGLLKRGIPLNRFRCQGPDSPTAKHIIGFRNFRYISLCVDSGNRENGSFSSIHTPYEPDYNIVKTALFKFLEAATELESLHISMTGDYNILVNFTDLLGSSSWQKLSLLILESIAFTQPEIIEFLRRHVSTLRHLTLWKCALKGAKACWADVIKAMSQLRGLDLESLTIKGPRYENGLPFLGPQLGLPTRDTLEGQYAYEPPEGSLLDYVNNVNDSNPYDQGGDYYRRQGCWDEVYSNCSDAVADAFENDEEDHEGDSHNNSDGLEYRSDFEPGSDDDATMDWEH